MTTISIIIATISLFIMLAWHLTDENGNTSLEPIVLGFIVLIVILLMT